MSAISHLWLRVGGLAARVRVRPAIIFVFIGLLLSLTIVFYLRLSRFVDRRLEQGFFEGSADIFAAPFRIAVGDSLSASEAMAVLEQRGYSLTAQSVTRNPQKVTEPVRASHWALNYGSEVRTNGSYRVTGDAVEIFPQGVRLLFAKEKIAQIQHIADGSRLNDFLLDPVLVTNLNHRAREKRRLVRFAEIPKPLVDALLSAEDRGFFQHGGLDFLRIIKAAYVDVTSRRKEQGGSTLTMQLARSLWLDPEKTWKRKATEILIAGMLEHKLTKQEIFASYCNQVYLGSHDTFQIHGFGEASRVYFNKEIEQVTLPEAALLAGIVQRPSYFDPLRNPGRARTRRNAVLAMMERNHLISATDRASASAAPLGIESTSLDLADAPYFLDLATDEARARLGPAAGPRNNYRIYTTLDLDLQRAAVESVRKGMERVDKQVRDRAKLKGALLPHQKPQVAMIALDPHTGEVKAAVGGRNYSATQLNRLRAKRQPGSVFKPFVYAAAMETQLGGSRQRFTGATVLHDEPTTFKFGDEVYNPGNFGEDFQGPVTARRALAASLNIPTVELAQAVGFHKVVDVAKRLGLNDGIRATPSVALGSYDLTPLEIAAAYTAFANKGVYVEPAFVSSITSEDGSRVYERVAKTSRALDPRIAYLMLDMLQEVMRSGTAGGVWSYGLQIPMAGKTGTAHDGWFAGFTSGLLCVVWVGFDDNHDLEIEGANSALPIWAEFMKRATKNGKYASQFDPPPVGMSSARIDDESGELAGPLCPKTHLEFFVAGAEPKIQCTLHGALPETTSHPRSGE